MEKAWTNIEEKKTTLNKSSTGRIPDKILYKVKENINWRIGLLFVGVDGPGRGFFSSGSSALNILDEKHVIFGQDLDFLNHLVFGHNCSGWRSYDLQIWQNSSSISPLAFYTYQDP